VTRHVNLGPPIRCAICHQSIPTGFDYVERDGLLAVESAPGVKPKVVRGAVRMHPLCVDQFDPNVLPEMEA
jgi:hypothetical protein